jgi:hypothetical protein
MQLFLLAVTLKAPFALLAVAGDFQKILIQADCSFRVKGSFGTLHIQIVAENQAVIVLNTQQNPVG